jgi:hypothetical protein
MSYFVAFLRIRSEIPHLFVIGEHSIGLAIVASISKRSVDLTAQLAAVRDAVGCG